MARVIEAKKRQVVVDRGLRLGPLRTGLGNLREFLTLLESHDPNPLTKPSLECVNTLARAVSVLEGAGNRFDRNTSSLTLLRPEIEKSAEELAAQRTFYDSRDAASFKASQVEKREKEARLRIVQKVSESFGQQASAAAEAAIKALQDYDRALSRERVRYSSLSPGGAGEKVSVNMVGWERMKLEAKSWGFAKMAAHLGDLVQVFGEDGSPELDVAEVIFLQLAAEYEDNPKPKPNERSGTQEENRRNIAKIRRLVEERRSRRLPQWLFLHDQTVRQALKILFANILGWDISTCSASDLAKIYGSERRDWMPADEWWSRYCMSDARALLSRNFSIDVKYRAPGTPTLSEALSQLKAAKG